MIKTFFTLTFFTIFLMPAFSNAQDEPIIRDIHISTPYSFGTMPGATTGAAFMKIYNKGSEDDKIIKVKSKIAKINELHENFIDPDDGKMMMRKVKYIDLPAGGHADLHPQGHHVMFIKMTEPLVLGTSVDIILTFEKSGTYKVTVPVVHPGVIPEEEPMPEKMTAEQLHDQEVPAYYGDVESTGNPVYKRIK